MKITQVNNTKQNQSQSFGMKITAKNKHALDIITKKFDADELELAMPTIKKIKTKNGTNIQAVISKDDSELNIHASAEGVSTVSHHIGETSINDLIKKLFNLKKEIDDKISLNPKRAKMARMLNYNETNH